MVDKQPDFQAACGLFKYCTIQQLNEYLDQESKLDDMIRDLPQVKEWDADKDLLLTANKSLAESNFKYEPQLKALKDELVEKSTWAQKLMLELTEKTSLLDKQGSPRTPDSVLAVLQAKHAAVDENSEEVATQFLDSEITVEAFLESYPKMRREAHTKRVQVDKLKEILRNRRISTSSMSSLGPVPSRSAPPPPPVGPGITPYPMNFPPGGMPVLPYRLPPYSY